MGDPLSTDLKEQPSEDETELAVDQLMKQEGLYADDLPSTTFDIDILEEFDSDYIKRLSEGQPSLGDSGAGDHPLSWKDFLPPMIENDENRNTVAKEEFRAPIDTHETDGRSPMMVEAAGQLIPCEVDPKAKVDWARLDPKVLKQIFDHATVNDVFFCQYVCRDWERVAIDYFKTTTTLHWRQLVHNRIPVHNRSTFCGDCLATALHRMPNLIKLDFRITVDIQVIRADRDFFMHLHRHSGKIREAVFANNGALKEIYAAICRHRGLQIRIEG